MKLVFSILSLGVALASAGRIDPGLKRKVDLGLVTEAIIELPQIIGQIQSNKTLQALSGDAKVSALVTTLKALASTTQSTIVAQAVALDLEVKQFWAANIILVKGLTTSKLTALGKSGHDFVIREQHVASVDVSKGQHHTTTGHHHNTPQWGLARMRVPEAWQITRGEGSVIGIIDTGVNLDHVALGRDSFAGAWLDPFYQTEDPTDEDGHGSHVTGTILGRENGIGVAPAAQWIACRGLDHHGYGSESSLTECAEFMLTAKPRPHIINNSWGGGSNLEWYEEQISAWRDAEMVPVFSIGNFGPDCGSANSPGDNSNVIAVGATKVDDTVSFFSSRGPKANGLVKPDFAAPGSDIFSCGTGSDDYVSASGTSMAAPHMSGAIALYLSHNKKATFDMVYYAFAKTAVCLPISEEDASCGLPRGNSTCPNNAIGWGLIDVAAALKLRPG